MTLGYYKLMKMTLCQTIRNYVCGNFRLVRWMTLSIGVAFSMNAHAYFDPGTGSIIIQALVGLGAFLLVSWSNLKTFISSKFRRNESEYTVVPQTPESKPTATTPNSVEQKLSEKENFRSGD